MAARARYPFTLAVTPHWHPSPLHPALRLRCFPRPVLAGTSAPGVAPARIRSERARQPSPLPDARTWPASLQGVPPAPASRTSPNIAGLRSCTPPLHPKARTACPLGGSSRLSSSSTWRNCGSASSAVSASSGTLGAPGCCSGCWGRCIRVLGAVHSRAGGGFQGGDGSPVDAKGEYARCWGRGAVCILRGGLLAATGLAGVGSRSGELLAACAGATSASSRRLAWVVRRWAISSEYRFRGSTLLAAGDGRHGQAPSDAVAGAGCFPGMGAAAGTVPDARRVPGRARARCCSRAQDGPRRYMPQHVGEGGPGAVAGSG